MVLFKAKRCGQDQTFGFRSATAYQHDSRKHRHALSRPAAGSTPAQANSLHGLWNRSRSSLLWRASPPSQRSQTAWPAASSVPTAPLDARQGPAAASMRSPDRQGKQHGSTTHSSPTAGRAGCAAQCPSHCGSDPRTGRGPDAADQAPPCPDAADSSGKNEYRKQPSNSGVNNVSWFRACLRACRDPGCSGSRRTNNREPFG